MSGSSATSLRRILGILDLCPMNRGWTTWESWTGVGSCSSSRGCTIRTLKMITFPSWREVSSHWNLMRYLICGGFSKQWIPQGESSHVPPLPSLAAPIPYFEWEPHIHSNVMVFIYILYSPITILIIYSTGKPTFFQLLFWMRKHCPIPRGWLTQLTYLTWDSQQTTQLVIILSWITYLLQVSNIAQASPTLSFRSTIGATQSPL